MRFQNNVLDTRLTDDNHIGFGEWLNLKRGLIAAGAALAMTICLQPRIAVAGEGTAPGHVAAQSSTKDQPEKDKSKSSKSKSKQAKQQKPAEDPNDPLSGISEPK